MVAVAARNPAGVGERWRQRSPISEGLSGRAISTGKVILANDYNTIRSGSQLAPEGMGSLVALPLRETGRVIGCLVVGREVGRPPLSEAEESVLRSYCEHVSAALSVARASDAMVQAHTDSLTGLANRVALLDRLEHELVRCDRGGEPVTVLFLDLDRFKIVNDSLGHHVGDRLLVAVAERLRRCIRDEDVCARLGGDEFAILLRGSTDPSAVAERIIESLRARFQIGEHEVFVSVSVGIATGREDADTLLRNADVAMYHAKRTGADGCARFEPSMHAARVTQLGLDTELRGAVERNEFELHYQPILELESGRIAAFEALLRWRHPDRGLVVPSQFIALAEETGLIVDIGHWVLAEACAQFAQWWRQAPLSLSVNVSLRELQAPDYAETVERAINAAFPPSALAFEVTESTPLQQARGALQTLNSIKELGSRVALDDFGTGYSSLVNLSELPVDVIKIAMPFVQAAGGGSRKANDLLAGILGLGRHLGLLTVAEGIERPEQRDALIELGCQLGQGYLYGRPLDAARRPALRRRRRAEPRSAALAHRPGRADRSRSSLRSWRAGGARC
jgi:diguanylate cyclase (GGDEF)-like protein